MFEVDCAALPSSKSLLNRFLILKSFFNEIDLTYNKENLSDDSRLLEKAIGDNVAKVFDCGHGAAPFRFLCIRLSRFKGEFKIMGSERLFERPQEELHALLEQLGVQVQKNKNYWILKSSGDWPSTVTLEVQKSSQLLTGLLLSACKLKQPFKIIIKDKIPSVSYAKLTTHLMKELGFQIKESKDSIILYPLFTLSKNSVVVEPDMGCAFVLAALGILKDGVLLKNIPMDSSQPDYAFVNVLQSLGAKVQFKDSALCVLPGTYKGGAFNLDQCPDLFPVLCALAASFPVQTTLSGLSVLEYKESKRITKMIELLTGVGAKTQSVGSHTLHIEGVESASLTLNAFDFDTDHDHRLAMAAALLNIPFQNRIQILNKEVVSKSFPDFWKYIS